MDYSYVKLISKGEQRLADQRPVSFFYLAMGIVNANILHNRGYCIPKSFGYSALVFGGIYFLLLKNNKIYDKQFSLFDKLETHKVLSARYAIDTAQVEKIIEKRD